MATVVLSRCDVYWREGFRSEGGPEAQAAALRAFGERMERYGLGGKLLLYRSPGPVGHDSDRVSTDLTRLESCPTRSCADGDRREYVGVTRAEADAVFRRADLLLNFN